MVDKKPSNPGRNWGKKPKDQSDEKLPNPIRD